MFSSILPDLQQLATVVAMLFVQSCINNNNNDNNNNNNSSGMELIKELGRCITIITGDPKETSYLFQRLSVAIQRFNAVFIRKRNMKAITSGSIACPMKIVRINACYSGAQSQRSRDTED